VLVSVLLVAAIASWTLPVTSFAAEESECEELAGEPQKLCKLYCDEIDCDGLITFTNFYFCHKILNEFRKITGDENPPCKATFIEI
jgi:hypothetical protein